MKKLLIIGGGNMGYAIAAGIEKNTKVKRFDKRNIIIIENKSARISFLRQKKFIVYNNISDVIKKYSKHIKIIILAVKPSDINTIGIKLKDLVNKKTIIISILAGVRLNKLSKIFSNKQPLVRVMPNIPIQINEGACALTYNKNVSKNNKIIINKIFESIGKTIETNEKYFDLITAASGSGPAYFCYFIECLINSAKQFGLNDKAASKLIIQTALGTILLLSKRGITPQLLRKSVTSPNGTTEAALKMFNKRNFQKIIHAAIQAASNRARELSRI